jgi:molybdopterin converting factor subunit 1
MRIRLLSFAVLREIVGSSELDLDVPAGSRALDVWQILRTRHPQLADMQQPPMTAINEEYADPAAELRAGDELAFIPPVAGG